MTTKARNINEIKDFFTDVKATVGIIAYSHYVNDELIHSVAIFGHEDEIKDRIIGLYAIFDELRNIIFSTLKNLHNQLQKGDK